MAGMGPPPKPAWQQRRPNRGLSLPRTHLPAAGRQGEPPAWPLAGSTKRELALWARLWKTPQAIEWERLAWTDTVARYARLLVVAERRGAAATVLSEVRQLEDRLGLSPMAMLRLRWIVVDDHYLGPPDLEVVDIRQRLRATD